MSRKGGRPQQQQMNSRRIKEDFLGGRDNLQSRGKAIATGLSGTSEPPNERTDEEDEGYDINESGSQTFYIQGEINNDIKDKQKVRDSLNMSQPVPALENSSILGNSL